MGTFMHLFAAFRIRMCVLGCSLKLVWFMYIITSEHTFVLIVDESDDESSEEDEDDDVISGALAQLNLPADK